MNAPHEDSIENVQDQCQRLLMILMDNQKRIDGMEREISLTRVSLDNVSRRLPADGDGGGGRAASSSGGSKQSNVAKSNGPRYWTPTEHSRFVEALEKYGRKDVKSIAKYVETRNATQVRTHAQKYFLRMKKEDPEQYARYVDDDEGDDVGNPLKRKAPDATFHVIGQAGGLLGGPVNIPDSIEVNPLN